MINDNVFIDLLEKARSGDKVARNKLIHSCIPFVTKIVNQYFKRWNIQNYVDRDDVFQAGLIGLDRAITSYDENRVNKLYTHGLKKVWYYFNVLVHNSIVIYLNHSYHFGVKTPVYISVVNTKVSKVRKLLYKDDSQDIHITFEELKKYYPKTKEADYNNWIIWKNFRYGFSFDAKPSRSTLTYGETTPDNSKHKQEYLDTCIDLDNLLKYIQRKGILTDKELSVFVGYYYSGVTLKSIGSYYNVSSERIRQIKNKAKAKLRRHFKNIDFSL